MYYITHYEEYPIYEPAEGGYYYAGRQATAWEEFNTILEAFNRLKEIAHELKEDGFVRIGRGGYYLTTNSKYIGENEEYIIETFWQFKNQECGWEPYC